MNVVSQAEDMKRYKAKDPKINEKITKICAKVITSTKS